jgi:hypothetical protein
MEKVEVNARIVAKNGRVWKLPTKTFTVSPNQLARCSYDWVAPGEGTYEFMAQLKRADQPVRLGGDTNSPHGGFDMQFTVGDPSPQVEERFPPWTNAPHKLDLGDRSVPCDLAVAGDVPMWFASGLEKVFPGDIPAASGRIEATCAINMARGERESFQLVLRPPEDTVLPGVRVEVQDLYHRDSQAVLAASDIEVYNVMYHPVQVPSHFKGPTGFWPDALPAHTPFLVEGGQTQPLWFTVYARPGLAAGIYTGRIVVHGISEKATELGLQVEVYDFTLPETPRLKTDFGFSMANARREALSRGGQLSPEALAEKYLDNAFAHRVTLRDLTQLPGLVSDYPAALLELDGKVTKWRSQGLSSIAVPGELLQDPAQLQWAEQFIQRHHLEGYAFTHLSDEPDRLTWERLGQRLSAWKQGAPHISPMVTTQGIDPYLDPMVGQWALHTPVFDTRHNSPILQEIAGGREVWWYVKARPQRPYGNFLLDFAGIDHRILFWQTWALGIKGMHYWNVNYTQVGQDPYLDLIDSVPTNGDGFLVYPGAEGPVNSIRWEIIRDGIEDYDYLCLFMEGLRRLQTLQGHEALKTRAINVYNLQELVPDLVSYTRDPQVLLKKRADMAGLIVDMDQVLKAQPVVTEKPTRQRRRNKKQKKDRPEEDFPNLDTFYLNR